MNRLTLISAAVLFLTPSAPLLGQSIPSNYKYMEDSQDASIYFGSFNETRGQYDLGPKSGPMFGSRYMLEIGGPAFIEARLGYISTTRDVIDPRRVAGQQVIGETDVGIVQFDARFGFNLTGRRTWRGLAPYVFSGGGLVFDVAGDGVAEENLPGNTRFDFGTNFSGSFGGGARFFLTDRLSIRGEGTVLLWKLKTPDGFDGLDSTLTNVLEEEWAGGKSLTISLAWRF